MTTRNTYTDSDERMAVSMNFVDYADARLDLDYECHYINISEDSEDYEPFSEMRDAWMALKKSGKSGNDGKVDGCLRDWWNDWKCEYSPECADKESHRCEFTRDFFSTNG